MSLLTPGSSVSPGWHHDIGIGIGPLERDVDYTLRGDVTSDADGSDADECEGDGLGEDIQLTVVVGFSLNHPVKFGGLGCNAGFYTVTLVLFDSDGQEIYSGQFRYQVGWTPATGQPIISGTAQVGETFTTDTSGIADDNGLDNATFAYQWIRSDGTTDTDITGATGSTYLVTTGDVGKTLKVRVSFTDYWNNDESLTSAPTAAVSATVPGAPRSLRVQPAGTGEISVSWQEPDSNGGASATGYTVQWKESEDSWDTAADVSSSTTATTSYTITSLSLGTEYSVRLIATNSAGDGPATAEETATADAQTSQQRAATQNSPATGVPTISGTAQAGETLTANTSGITDEDGLDDAIFSYQWMADDAGIAGATGSTYTLTDSDAGKTIKVQVSFTDDASNSESLTSAPLDPSRPYGLTATVSNGAVVLTWKPPEVLSNLYSLTYYQILRNRPELGETEPQVYVEYTETNETSYTDTDVEPGVLYVYRVKAADYFGRLGEASESVEIRTPESVPVGNNPATGAPAITGTAQVGETLTASTSGIADEDGLDDATFNYQWIRNDGSAGADIQNATDSTYTLTSDDEGKTIKVRVSFTDDGGNAETLTSGATAAVASAATPLTASIHDVPQEGHDGQNAFTFELRFSEEPDSDFSYKTLRDHAFTVTGGTVTNARRLEKPSNVRWEITVEPSSDAGVSIVLPETTDCQAGGTVCTADGRMLSAQVALTVAGPAEEQELTPPANNPATGAPTISGTAQVGETLTASTSGIADEDGLDSVIFTYQWLADAADIQGATNATYTLADVDEGKVIKVRVSFADDVGNDEALTSDATGVVAAAPNRDATGTPTINGTVQVGETLTADTSGIADEDGLDDATFAYQWISSDSSADSDIQDATGSSYTLTDSDEGNTIKVRVLFTDDAGNSESLTSASTVAVAPRLPLTASFQGKPSNHDGQTAFTFELHFSEEFELSYVTLRDHAFAVTNGTVTNARRLTQGSNIGWEITVTPDSEADVTVDLPVTTDCNATGALCTADGRKLSNRLEFTVSGPSE